MTLQSQSNSQQTSNTRTLHHLASLYQGDQLPELTEMLDQLHSAATDGQLRRFTTLKPSELAVLLHELIYVAQETLNELESQPEPAQRPTLTLLPRAEERAEQGA
jgi:hypothetical protein